MKQKIFHLWMLIGVCTFSTLTVDSLDYKIKNRNHLSKYPIYERVYPSFASAVGHIQEGSSFHDLSTLNKSQKKEDETERPEKKDNDTEQILKSEIKNIEGKFYNKKRMIHPSKLEESHAKRENFFFRLFSDNYKPHKQRSVMKKKRETNGLIRKLEVVNVTIYPPISRSVIPLSLFGRDRKLNDDKICKTQIIKFFPKQLRKSFENKNIGNESRRQLFNDNNNEWELRQDIFVEEILPFREKNDFGFKDIFHDEAKTIFDDILSIFTMLPFSIFDTIYVKLSTTEKPKVSLEHAERLDYYDTSLNNFREKRQANPIATNSSTNNSLDSKDNLYIANDNPIAAENVNVTNTTFAEIKTTNETNEKITKNIVDTNGVIKANYKPDNPLELQINTTVAEKASTIATASEKPKSQTDLEKLNKPATSLQHAFNSSTELYASTSTGAELSKQKIINPKDVEMLEMSENEDHYEESIKNVEEEEEEADPPNDKNGFLMVLGVIPGLVGLIIAVGVVGIWMIQKNSSWVERSNQGNEPTTSSQAKPPHSMNI